MENNERRKVDMWQAGARAKSKQVEKASGRVGNSKWQEFGERASRRVGEERGERMQETVSRQKGRAEGNSKWHSGNVANGRAGKLCGGGEVCSAAKK
jgi:hypothetical protein